VLARSVRGGGVETEAQAAILRELGCPTYQGYLFAAPMSLDNFSTWVSVPRTRAEIDTPPA